MGKSEKPARPYFRGTNKRKLVMIYAISILAFTAFMGVFVPPFFKIAVDLQLELTPQFWFASFIFGLLIALINFLIFKIIDYSIKIEKFETAAIDTQTGLLNKTFGHRRLEEEISRAIRYNIPLSLILLELESISWVAEKYGEAAESKVYKHISGLVEKDARACDVVSRFEQGKFMIVLPRAEMKNAAVMAERLRWLLETSPLEYKGTEVKVTASAGVATMKAGEKPDREMLMKMAQTALESSINSGGNLVSVNRGGEISPFSDVC